MYLTGTPCAEKKMCGTSGDSNLSIFSLMSRAIASTYPCRLYHAGITCF